MLKLNDTSGNKNEIGNSIDANVLEYASIKKFSTFENKQIDLNDSRIKLHKLILHYERDECLIAIQFVLKRYDNLEAATLLDWITTDKAPLATQEKDNIIYTDPKIFGPLDSDTMISNNSSITSTPNIIDEIVLELSPDEEIYLIKGTFEKNKTGRKNQITRMAIYTTYGQYIEFGKSNVEYNFSWEYFFNLRFFDGFIIGWNEKNISYLASLVVEKTQANYDEKNITLTDTTYIRSYFVEPMYLSPRYGGKIDTNTIIIDDLMKLNIMNDIKMNNSWYISEITVYYDKMVNCIEVEYTNRKGLIKVRSSHVGKEARKNKDKKSVMNIDPDDFVNYVKVNFENYVNSLTMRTFRGKTLNCSGTAESENKIELVENNKERSVNLIGFVVGTSDRINSVQFYYERRLV